jgi:hypothetical protein
VAPEVESAEVGEDLAVPQNAENEIVAAPGAAEDNYVPPAIEEETIEA